MSMNPAPLFKSSPGVKLTNPRNRTLKKPQKICALNLSQVMTNRWLGVLKSKIPCFDMEDFKTLRHLITDNHRRQSAAEYSQQAYLSML